MPLLQKPRASTTRMAADHPQPGTSRLGGVQTQLARIVDGTPDTDLCWAAHSRLNCNAATGQADSQLTSWSQRRCAGAAPDGSDSPTASPGVVSVEVGPVTRGA
jgi:hypothetical protein